MKEGNKEEINGRESGEKRRTADNVIELHCTLSRVEIQVHEFQIKKESFINKTLFGRNREHRYGREIKEERKLEEKKRKTRTRRGTEVVGGRTKRRRRGRETRL